MRLSGALPMAVAIACLCEFTTPSHAQDQVTAHRMAARQYEIPGMIEEAVAEYVKILALAPDDADARTRVDALVRKQMPRWLPEEVERAAPFTRELLAWTLAASAAPTDAGAATPQRRFIVSHVNFAAREGERWDELHEKGFPGIDYGYVWSPVRRRYEVRVVAHWEEQGQAALAHDALKNGLLLYALVRAEVGFDPTGQWGDPVDIWVTHKGEPGARAQGRSIYLYAAQTPRPAGEWLREMMHEYGHVSFPGIGGFTQTDDPWVDGDLSELLLPRWLVRAGAPDWLPWPVTEWEAQASAQRARLMAGWTEGDVSRLAADGGAGRQWGDDADARESFLGLALWIEDTNGARALADTLRMCRRGSPAQFAKALAKRRSDRPTPR